MPLRTCLGAALAVALTTSSALAGTRDGQLFDHGAAMTELAPGAPEGSEKALPLLGHWDVSLTTYPGEGEPHQAVAVASITLMNRGHSFLERFMCADFDGQGNPRNTVSFLTRSSTWSLGIADSWTESITLLTGEYDSSLVTETVIRSGGSTQLQHYRVIIENVDDDSFTMRAEAAEFGDEFSPLWTRHYRRASTPHSDLAGEDYGSAAPDLPPEAAQFDFLLGEWNNTHQMTFPGGNQIGWVTNATAVRMLDGHAIMEHSWFDTDPNLPDAATTILRLYNRSMRRWESMYTTNRGNNILHFGGVQEGDDIVLHPFETSTASSQINYWTFHSMQANSYGWYANTSKDRGATFEKTWVIEAARKTDL